MRKKVIITGGHFTPGLAIIPVLQKRGYDVLWVGVKHALSGTQAKTLEVQILPGLKVPFHAITTGKLHRHSLLSNVENLWKMPLGLVQSVMVVNKVRPQAVLSFGGFVSVPICFVAKLFGIPIVIHEQTAASGLANRIVAKFADQIAISFSSSLSDFPKDKVILTGNLIRRSIFSTADKPRKKTKAAVIYITGGSRGSQTINAAVRESIYEILKLGKVIHQTGQLDLPFFESLKKDLGERGEDYIVVANFKTEEVEKVFLEATVAISRSGANTVSEFAVMGIPAIFIPLPFSEKDEQTKNAQVLVDAGLAQILPQKDLNGATLLKKLTLMLKDINSYTRNASAARKLVPIDAPERVAQILEDTLNKQ